MLLLWLAVACYTVAGVTGATGATPGTLPAAGGDVASVLVQLAELRSQGLLTADEFAIAKARTLGSREGHGTTAGEAAMAAVPGVQGRAVGAAAVFAAVAGLFALDSAWRISTLKSSQIAAWVCVGVLPCAAFGAAVLVPPEQLAAVPPGAGVGAVVTWALEVQQRPLDVALHTSGQLSIRCLVACLAVTPLRNLSGKGWLHPLRQTFGLLASSYAAAHAVVYAVEHLEVERIGDRAGLAEAAQRLQADLSRRPYILFGLMAAGAMLLLAVTSYHSVRMAMGKRWGQLHKLNYLLSIAAGVHVWQYQQMRPSVVVFGSSAYPAAVALLLGWRLWVAVSSRLAKKKSQ